MRGLWLVAFAVSIGCTSSSTNDEPNKGGNDASTGGSAGASGGGAGVGNGGTPATGGTAGSGVAGAVGTGGGAAGTVSTDAGTEPCAATGVVINEISTRNGTFPDDEFIELYNGGSASVELANFRVRYAGATGVPVMIVWTGTAADKIFANSHFLIMGSGFSGSKIGGYSTSAIGDSGGIGLFDQTDTPLDAVGYGSIGAHPYIEGSPVANASSAGYGIGRLPDGYDCQNNSSDFQTNLQNSPGTPNL